LLRKTVSAIMLSLLVISTLTLAFSVQPVKAEPRTWIVDDDGPADFHTIQEAINAGGDGDTVFVRDGTYYEHIVVNKTLTLIGEDRNSTIVDGTSNGEIMYVWADNVTISNFTLQNAGFGTYGAVAVRSLFANAQICNNTLIDNRHGVAVESGAINVTVSGNLIYNKQPSYADGVRLFSSETTVADNMVVNESTGIGLDWAYDNVISNNTVVNSYIGIGAGNPSYNNTFSENTVLGNIYGFLIAIYNSKFFHNNIVNNNVQVAFYDSSYANIWDNGFPSGGNYWSDYNGVDANGDGIGDTPYTINANNRDHYPLMNKIRSPYPPVADFTWAPSTLKVGEPVSFNASSSLPGWNGTHTMPITEYRWNFGDSNITSTVDPIIIHTYASPKVFNVTLTVSDIEGLNSSRSQMIPTRMPTLVSISTSSSSTFIGFTVDINGTLCDLYGNGLENEPVVLYYTFSGVTTWFPITSGITNNLGHYYAQWIPYATGYFTIKAEWVGNTTYIGASNNVTLSVIPYENQYVFSVESNSTISALAFNTTSWELSFTASGPSGTKGYVKVTVAKSLVENITNIRAYLDGNQTEFSITSIDDSWLLTFNYIHSTHQIVVDLDINIIPEFPLAIILPLFAILTILAVACKFTVRRKRWKNRKF